MTSLGWAYVAFGTTTLLVATWVGLIQRVQIGEAKGLLRLLAVAALAISLVALSGAPGAFGATLAALSLLVSGGFLFLGNLAGQSDQRPNFAVGDALPAFEAPDHNGDVFESSSLRGKPLLIKFFRGHW